MPQVKIRATFDGREESMTEYICDWPDCPNVANKVVGFGREPRLSYALCAEHAAKNQNQENRDTKR
jgi:hypothetical protein